MRAAWSTLTICCLWAAVALSGSPDENRPRYPKPVERPRPPVGPDGEPLVTVDGRWYSTFGYMDLEQQQWDFEGTYSCCDGKIHGELVAQGIEFFWQDPIYGKGWGYFSFRDQGKTLVGSWGREHDMGSSGGWKAVRLDERSYEGEPTQWRIEASHPQLGEVRGEAKIFVAGDALAGELEGAAATPTRETREHRHEVFRYLEGRRRGDTVILEWRNPLTERRGEIRLEGTGDRLEGTWHITEEIAEPITFERLPADDPQPR